MEIQPQDEQRLDTENIENKESLLSNESALQQENVADEETGAVANASVTPDEEAEEDNGNTKRNKNNNVTTSSATAVTTVLGAVAAVAIAVVIFINGIVNVVANFVSIAPYGKSIDFVTTIAFDYTPSDETPLDFSDFDTNTFLTIYNNRFSRVVPLVTKFKGDEYGTALTSEVKYTTSDNKNYKVEITFNGNITGLTTNTRYKLEVFGFENDNKKTYATSTIKTVGQKTAFTSVVYKCQCQVDGNVYYWLNYIDENDYYSNFRYSIINKNDNTVIASGQIDNPKEKQAIDVSAYEILQFALVISYDSTAPSDVASGNTTVTITTDVEL